MAEQVFLNGELVAADEAAVGVFDAAFQHGVGLFEVLRSYAGRVFRLTQHVERLKESAAALGMVVDMDAAGFADAIDKLLRANDLTDARVRITVTGGSVRVGIHQGAQSKPTMLITAGPAQTPPPECYAQGVGALLSAYRLSPTDPIARHQTISYLPRLMALRAAQHAHLAEAIWFTDEGYLAGGSMSNVFLIRDDVLLTPALDLPILPGITRRVVIELAKELQFPLREGKFSMEETLAAGEIFLTNCVIELLPVVALERHRVGDGKVGTLTRTLLQKYRRRVREELNLP